MVGTDGCCVAGFSEHTLRAVEFWRQRAGRMERERGEAVKGGVKFVPKFRLPEVHDYQG